MAGTKSNKKKKKAAAAAAAMDKKSNAHGSMDALNTIASSTVPANMSQGVMPAGIASTKPNIDPLALLKRSLLLKEEGNKQFASKKFEQALHAYEAALKFLPAGHEDRAVLHSNRAACFLQMRPCQLASIVAECDASLAIDPHFPRALLRRAKARHRMGDAELAAADLRALLQLQDAPNHAEAQELLAKISAAQAAADLAAAASAASPAQTVQSQRAAAEVGGEGGPEAAEAEAAEVGGEEEEEGADEQQVMLDDWFLELSDLVRLRLGLDPTRGSEALDYEASDLVGALDEAVTSDDATPLLEAAEAKFANMTAMVLINWASVHRVLALKKSSGKKQKQKVEEEDEGVREDGGGKKEEGKTTQDKEEEEEETEEEVQARQLADYDWKLKHLAIALEKYGQALAAQPSMVDALAGSAFCLAEKAQTEERKAELLLLLLASQPIGGNPLTRGAAAGVKQGYEAALQQFVAANEALERLESEFVRHHSESCTDPQHNHGSHDDGSDSNSHSLFLDNVKAFREQMFGFWVAALIAAAHFTYKLGTQEWPKYLKEAAKLSARVGTGGGGSDWGSDLPEPLKKLLAQHRSSEDADSAPSGGIPEDSGATGNGTLSEWAKVWAGLIVSSAQELPTVQEVDLLTEGAAEEAKGQNRNVKALKHQMFKSKSESAKTWNERLKDTNFSTESTETDEPMKPVRDLVGKFQNLSKK